MNDRLIAIESLHEQPEGITFRQHGGEMGLLCRSHPRYEQLAQLLRLTLTLGVGRAWPVYAHLGSDGVLVSARSAMRGTLLGAAQDADGGYSVALFAVSTLKKLRQEHPEFERLKGVLLGAWSTRQDIYYALAPGDLGVLVDVALAS